MSALDRARDRWGQAAVVQSFQPPSRGLAPAFTTHNEAQDLNAMVTATGAIPAGELTIHWTATGEKFSPQEDARRFLEQAMKEWTCEPPTWALAQRIQGVYPLPDPPVAS
jgi:hypothetical protein